MTAKFLNNKNFVFTSLAVISLIYFCLFIPINISGSDELSKIRIFSSIDEYSQINALEQMLQTSGKSFKNIVGDFLLHSHAYGYPFFFFSALVAIPVKMLHLPRPEELEWMMLVLRQQVVLFNILSCLLLTYLWVGFKRFIPSVLLFIFLLSIPAVNKHNILWHPDALSTLFIVLTLFCLVKDDFRFKKWFFFSAVACGMACSTKFMGPFLFLLILTYLLLALRNRNEKIKILIGKAFLYGLVTIAVFVLSSPLILFGYYQNVLDYLSDQSKMNNFGWGVEMPKGIIPWYNEVIREYFFYWWVILGLLIVSGYSILKKSPKQNLNLLTLAAILPLFVYVVSIIGHKNYFYLYPVFLLLGGTAGNIFHLFQDEGKRTTVLKPVFIISALALALISVFNTGHSYNIYEEKEQMIAHHPSFGLYHKIEQAHIIDPIEGRPFKVLYSPFIYLPDSLKVVHSIPYGLLSAGLIKKENPDVIIFERTEAATIGDTAYQKRYIDPDAARAASKFYQTAITGKLPGYTVNLADKYAIVLKKINEKQ